MKRFSLAGSLSMFDATGAPLGTTAVNGSGNASILAATIPGAVTAYNVRHISYQRSAQSPAAPTPEPASIALPGMALGGGFPGRKLWRRRQRIKRVAAASLQRLDVSTLPLEA